MLAIHPNARTTAAVRAEIARSGEPTGELARRYGVSTGTIRKWRKRGPAECRDRPSRSTQLATRSDRTEASAGTSRASHQARGLSDRTNVARRVCGLRIVAAKNSRKRISAQAPAAATRVGT